MVERVAIVRYPLHIIMSELLDFHSLFTQLQSRYPTSSLVAELVDAQADRFVVRALVQLGGVTLATGLASATTIEAAEDQARLRVLALLGLHKPADRAPLNFAIPTPSFTSSPMQPSSTQPFETVLPDSKPLASVPLTTLPEPEFTPAAPPEVTPAVPVTAVAQPVVPQPSIAPLSFDSDSLDLENSGSDQVDYAFEPGLNSEFVESDSNLADDRSLDEPEDMPVEYASDEEEFPLYEPLTPTTSGISVDLSMPTSKPSKTKKAAPAAPIATEPLDLSSLIALTDVEMQRTGLSKKRGQAYLMETFGKQTRADLDEDQLLDFLNYLKALPSRY